MHLQYGKTLQIQTTKIWLSEDLSTSFTSIWTNSLIMELIAQLISYLLSKPSMLVFSQILTYQLDLRKDFRFLQIETLQMILLMLYRLGVFNGQRNKTYQFIKMKMVIYIIKYQERKQTASKLKMLKFTVLSARIQLLFLLVKTILILVEINLILAKNNNFYF